jgi:AcrR family transcriptional regulator
MNNRENLLKQALELFTARGYDAVGVQEIADAAGIKKPTLYHYFGSKSGLLSILFTEHFDPFFETLQAAAEYKGDVTNTLRSVAGAYFNFARQNPRLYRFYLSMWFAAADSDAFKVSVSFSIRQQQLMETLFTCAANDHGNMKGRQRTYAASFLGLVNTYVMLFLNGYAELDDAQVYSMLHQFMHGIFS